jgi:hypothetical protein
MCYHLVEMPVKVRADHAKWLSEDFNYAWRKVDKQDPVCCPAMQSYHTVLTWW